jgi:hypothetical protein
MALLLSLLSAIRDLAPSTGPLDMDRLTVAEGTGTTELAVRLLLSALRDWEAPALGMAYGLLRVANGGGGVEGGDGRLS